MLIENPDAFKTWLTSILEPLCEADPAALAKYVYALVKKDKPLDDLRDGMVDQLDVFLQSETKPFVELLFKTLETQEYLTPVSSVQSGLTASSTTITTHLVTSSLQQDNAITGPPSPTDDKAEIRPPIRDIKAEKEDLDLKSLAPRSHADKRESASATKHRIVLNRTTKFVPATVPKEKPAYATEQTLVKVMPDLLEDSMNEPLPARNSRRDRKSDSDKEDRRRRVYRSRSRSWERSRRALPAPTAGRWRNRSPPLQTRRSRSGSPPPLRAPRYRNVSPPPPGVTDIEPPKNRSRSRSRERMSPLPATALRDRLDRVSRERDRDRSGRSDRPIRDRLDQRERIDRDRIMDQRERERIDRDNREQRLDRDRRVMRDPPGGADTPTQDSNPGDCAGQSRGTTTTLAGIFAPIAKKRCRDFDEKGYCMRGDLCQFDHGLDPVVLEDATLSRVLALPITGIPPPRPIPGHLAEYNPLAPDIWSRGQQPPPSQPHPNNRFSAPPPPPPPPHQLHPSHPNHPQHHLQMARELIPIPTVRVEDLRPTIGQIGAKGSNGQQNMSVRPPALPGSGAQFPGQNQGPLPINNYNRRVFVPGQNNQSRHISPKMQGGNCSLELKKVPRGLNDILHLNNHFSKFGKIVNIQVSFEGDPEAAIITFSSHTEANVAYKSTEAVLNNRFIKVFWHNTESKQENVPPGQRVPVKDGKLTLPNQHHNNNNHGSHNKVLINKDNLKITNTALAEAKLLTQQKLQKQQLEDAASGATASNAAGSAAAVSMEAVTPTSGEKEATKMTNGEASQKPENGTARQETANIEMAALVKKRGEGHVKIVRDLRRRTQLLLEKQLGQQKALIIRLEENTIASQKDALLITIKQMQGNIDKTRKDLAALTKASQQHTEESGVLDSLNNMSLSAKSKYTTTNSIVGTIVKKPRSKEEAQKEILDAELDLFTKQQEGQDVTELMRKVAELRRQQSVLRHSSALANRRGAPQRAATRAKFSKIAAMAKGGGLYVNQSVDHRPRSLLISGYEGDEQTLVEQHFAQYGEIVRRVVDSKTPSLWIQYDSRKAAELASAKGKQFNDRTLSVTWMDPLKRQAPQPAVLPSTTPGPSTEPETSAIASVPSSDQQPLQQQSGESKQPMEGVASNNADESNSTIDDQEFEGGVELSEDILLQDDEEEDEEDRSWRR